MPRGPPVNGSFLTSKSLCAPPAPAAHHGYSQDIVTINDRELIGVETAWYEFHIFSIVTQARPSEDGLRV